jgi:hypothetical protein
MTAAAIAIAGAHGQVLRRAATLERRSHDVLHQVIEGVGGGLAEQVTHGGLDRVIRHSHFVGERHARRAAEREREDLHLARGQTMARDQLRDHRGQAVIPGRGTRHGARRKTLQALGDDGFEHELHPERVRLVRPASLVTARQHQNRQHGITTSDLADQIGTQTVRQVDVHEHASEVGMLLENAQALLHGARLENRADPLKVGPKRTHDHRMVLYDEKFRAIRSH